MPRTPITTDLGARRPQDGIALDPGRDCPLCPRLAAFRDRIRGEEPGWFNAPVPIFGSPYSARLLVVGLAPGLKGANRTGRPFTGDYAGELLYRTLLDYGFASGVYEARPDDGLILTDALIANAVRCVPPRNKPLPEEIRTCRPFLEDVAARMPRLAAIIALGRIAHDSVLRAHGMALAAAPFGHARRHALTTRGTSIVMFDSYHCSRYNTNTGVLTEPMFRAVFAAVREMLTSMPDEAF